MPPALIISAVMELVDKIFPSDSPETAQKKLDLQAQMMTAASARDVAQAQVNQQEATSNNLFVSGWRPAIGWTCAISFFYGFVLRDFIDYYLQLKGLPPLAQIDTMDLMVVMGGILGINVTDMVTRLKGMIK